MYAIFFSYKVCKVILYIGLSITLDRSIFCPRLTRSWFGISLDQLDIFSFISLICSAIDISFSVYMLFVSQNSIFLLSWGKVIKFSDVGFSSMYLSPDIVAPIGVSLNPLE